MTVALITVPLALGIITGLLTLLWFPGIIQWVIETVPIPAKAQIQGVILRTSAAAAAYRNQKPLVLVMLLMSFLVHFCTAAMYFFMAIAVGAGAEAVFWPVVFGSAIQIFATVIGPTIGGIGIREAAQVLTLGALLGPIVAAVSATLGFWVGEVPTLFGFVFWMVRGPDYTPRYCRVDGEQVDYEETAQMAVELESAGERHDREAREVGGDLPDAAVLAQPSRLFLSCGMGMGAGILAGILIGCIEAALIGTGGFGPESQVLWYGPLVYALILGALGTLGGAVLSILPMREEEVRGWVPTLGFAATLVPLGLAVLLFRVRRDVYLEQMPPLPVLLGVLGGAVLLAIVILAFGRRFFQSPLGAVARPLPAILLLGVVMGAGAIFGPSETVTKVAVRAEIPTHLQDRPNVVLVIADTLRADHLGAYGDLRGLTPNLDAMADEGTVWQAFGQSSWTKPSVATILTSLYASSHGAMSKPAILPEVTTIADALQSEGYATSGFVSNINLAPSFNFQQGFDEYTYYAPDYLFGAEESSSKLVIYSILRVVNFKMQKSQWVEQYYQDSRTVNADALEWLSQHKDDRFFTLIHYMDPHDPYFVHPYEGRGIARVDNQNPDPSQAAEMLELYAGEIQYMDASFGALRDQLREHGIYDNTLIIFTADHGEEFQEHGGWWHGTTLYEEQVAVPLIAKYPAGRLMPARPGGVGRLLDVAPTILAAAGTNIPVEWQGTDLALSIPSNRVAFAEEDHEGNIITAARSARFKLIRSNPGNPRGLPEVELFDLQKDPGEQADVAAERGAEVDDLDREIVAITTGAAADAVANDGEVQMDDATRDRLRALGYIE
jgi:arylsulfatase A-like enzyme